MDGLLEELGWLRLEEVGHPNLDFFAVFEFFFLPKNAESTGTNGNRIAPGQGCMAELPSLIPRFSVA